jgi:hypothetical protein
MRGLARALERFIAAPDWRRSARILRRHPELLGLEARRRLEDRESVARTQGDDDIADAYLFYRSVLDRCREVGAQRGIDEQAGLGSLIQCAEHADGDAAVDGFRRAAALTLPGDTRRAGVLSALGEALMGRFARCADGDALDEAVTAFETAVLITEEAEPAERAALLGNLGVALSERHLLHLDPVDIRRAVDAYRETLRLTPPGAPELGQRQANLGTGLAERYASLGDPADLEQAITAMRASIFAPAGSSGLCDRRENLALALRDRYLLRGDLADLDLAVAELEAAVAGRPADDAGVAEALDQLAVTLRMRALRRRDEGQLRRALELHRRALDCGWLGAVSEATMLANRAGTLRALYQLTQERATLNEAIRGYRRALGASSPDGIERPAILSNLGAALLDAGGEDDLASAIHALRAAAGATPETAPDRPARLGNLANGLRRRHSLHGDQDDLAAAVAAYRDSSRHPSEAGLRSALNWSAWAVAREAWSEVAEAADVGAATVMRLVQRQLLRRDKESWLVVATQLLANGAYALARTGTLRCAAERVEEGRARLLSEGLDLARTDLSELAGSRPELVERLRAASVRIAALERRAALQAPTDTNPAHP